MSVTPPAQATRMANGISIDIDYQGYLNALDAIGRVAFPYAVAETLNKSAFHAQKALTQGVLDFFDRPNRFTQQAFVVRKADRRDGDAMSSAVRAKDTQAAYLKLQIEGGTRTKDDPGVRGAFDIMTFSVRKDKSGGIPRNFIKALSAEKSREARQRLKFGAHKDELREQWAREDDAKFDAALEGFDETAFALNRKEKGRKPKIKARRRLTYQAAHGAGIFFGEFGGVRGYWRRAKRTEATGPRRRGVWQVQDVGDPTLLLRVQDEARYTARFPYTKIIKDSYSTFGAADVFRKELEKQVIFRIERASMPKSSAPLGTSVLRPDGTRSTGWRKVSFPPR